MTAATGGLDDDLVGDLAVVARELLSNSLQHGRKDVKKGRGPTGCGHFW
jgi:two-component sensor histidine kinase